MKKTKKKQSYEMWAIEAIRLVLATPDLGRLYFDEIKCIVNKDGYWYQSWQDGDSPQEPWQEELSVLMSGG